MFGENMTEYKNTRRYEPLRLEEEVFWEINLLNQPVSQNAGKDYSRMIHLGKEAIFNNTIGFFIGVVVGTIDEMHDIRIGRDYSTGEAMGSAFSITFLGRAAPYFINRKKNADFLEGLPGMFIGLMLSQYFVRRYTGK